MWVRTYSKVYPEIKRENVWAVWADINQYTKWHHDLDSCTMTGAFVVGNYFMLKPKGGPTFKVTLTHVKEGWAFTDCTKFLGAKMYDHHEMEETSEGLRITNTIIVTGLLSFLWVKLVAAGVADNAPEEQREMIEFLKEKHV